MIIFFKISKFFLIVSVLAVALVTPSTLFPFIVGKYVWFRTSIDLALIFFLLGLLLYPYESAKIFQFKEVQPPKVNGQYWEGQTSRTLKSPLVIAVMVFIAVFLLAGFFGVDPKMSFWSNFERGEGGLQLLHFGIFFILLTLLFREKNDWKQLFWWMLIGGVLMSLYGFLAATGVQGFIGGSFRDERFRPSGSIGNPAYTAAYSIFMLFYAAYLLVSEYRHKLLSAGAITLYIFSVIFAATFLFAATRGAFMGLIASALMFLVYFMYSHKRWRKWLVILIILILITVGILIRFKDNPLVKSIPGSRIFDISFSAKTFQDRTMVWKIAWDGFRERPSLGWGPENYIQVFDRHFNIKFFKPSEGFGAWFDRAHSIYFDYLVETGILGLLSFLSIWVVFYWQFFRTSRIN